MPPAKSPEMPEFMRRQYAFAAHIRDPEKNPPPEDVTDRRMAVYRELFFNNLEGFLANNFPVLRSLLEDQAWHYLVRDFYARHRAQTPLFHEISREFLLYLETERTTSGDPPFLGELAHYEWIELALSLSDLEPSGDIDPEGDLLEGLPVISPLAWPLRYRFPVHRISRDYQPIEPEAQPTFLVVYRDPHDQVAFMELNPVTARLLELISKEEVNSGRETLVQIAHELQHPNLEQIIGGGQQTLTGLRTRHILLGTRKS
ncbi:conserved hypothetical protein [Nitrosococcus halophilus Nc 4]|uniref:Uncharacterized protein n=1 Tax=Nitrosococcus halophilus (strain Nc4) TaxID=472759 RepID=D5BXB0_NITHN|nr:putative DNA-binding domain-containing protein [Nitrosococcus halophilus]ADE15793.1 conserved hypothetical protein [Nitrosococcus halophilus Nc 4]